MTFGMNPFDDPPSMTLTNDQKELGGNKLFTCVSIKGEYYNYSANSSPSFQLMGVTLSE